MIARLLACSALVLLTAGAARAASAGQRERVDVALVLAADVSASMNRTEHTLQRRGYAQAFREPALVTAIRAGDFGRIAVTYVEWASGEPTQVLPWATIASAQDARKFADAIDAAPLVSGYRTSISTGLLYSADLIDRSGYAAARRVIDVSGDGANNIGMPVAEARDAVVRRGIVINGLPIAPKQPLQFYDIANLTQYYHDCVIGGGGAFIEPANGLGQFADAIRRKLVSEIADLGERRGLYQPAQARAPAPHADCLAGEKAWSARMGAFGDDFGDLPLVRPRPR